MREKSKYWGKPSSAPPHPYREYEGTRLRKSVKKALADLEKNQDIALTEWHQYVVEGRYHVLPDGRIEVFALPSGGLGFSLTLRDSGRTLVLTRGGFPSTAIYGRQ